MTHLSQICADMVQAQRSLQSIARFQRSLAQQPGVPRDALDEGVRHALASQRYQCDLFARCIGSYAAANDDRIGPEAA